MISLRWRVLRDPPQGGGWNMALDEGLARSAKDGEAVLRLYAWDAPTISFGRNEPARGRYSEARGEALGLQFVRRPTGGRAVLHDQELTYAVILPARALGSVRAVYGRINAALARAIGSVGATVGVSADGSVEPLDAGPCFQSPARGEVVAGERKLVGSAQAKIGRVILQHGSILLAGDQSRLASVSLGGGDFGQPASLDDLVPAVDVASLGDAVVEEMGSEFAGEWAESDATARERRVATELFETRYAQGAWTWRL